jgi:hypothetical protein
VIFALPVTLVISTWSVTPVISIWSLFSFTVVHKGIHKITELEQSYKGKVKTQKYINRQNQPTTGQL